MTQKQILINYLQESGKWIEGFKLRGFPTKWGFVGSQGDRRLRELAHEGKIDHKIENGFSFYRAKPKTFKTYHILDANGNREQTIKMLK